SPVRSAISRSFVYCIAARSDSLLSVILTCSSTNLYDAQAEPNTATPPQRIKEASRRVMTRSPSSRVADVNRHRSCADVHPECRRVPSAPQSALGLGQLPAEASISQAGQRVLISGR